MNHPRFRVRTLLIVTTVVAVVVACLSPWLRLMTASQLAGIGVRMGFGVLGASVIWWSIRRSYRRTCHRERAEETGIVAQGLRVRPNTSIWFLAAFMLSMAIFVEFLHAGTTRTTRAGSLLSWIDVIWLFWFSIGSNVARCFLGRLYLRDPVYLTPTWFISPWVCCPWGIGIDYEWLDRSAGKLSLTFPSTYCIELSIDPQDVDEVHRLLSHLLDPPKYQAPSK